MDCKTSLIVQLMILLLSSLSSVETKQITLIIYRWLLFLALSRSTALDDVIFIMILSPSYSLISIRKKKQTGTTGHNSQIVQLELLLGYGKVGGREEYLKDTFMLDKDTRKEHRDRIQLDDR